MNKSIYNTPNDTSYEQKHDIFRNRFKDLCKNKYLTYEGLAGKVGYAEDTVKSWARTKGHFPNMDTLVKLSCIFDVDVAYLLGDQDFKKIKSQRIHDLSGLNEKASDMIDSTNLNACDTYVLNRLLTHKNFPRLLDAMYQYAHCHNIEIKMEDNTFPTDDFFPFTDSKKKMAFKFTATDTLSEILEDMYKENEGLMKYAKGRAELEEMFNMIQKYYFKHEDNDDDITEALLKVIDAYLKTLPEYSTYNIVRKFSSEDILKNYKEIAKLLDISLISSDSLQKGSD